MKNKICWLESNNTIISNRKEFFNLKNSSKAIFHVNKAFESIDWTIEPSKSLKQLFKERAEQLRDLYDYIIIYFSGGSDSITVVNAFLDNNIPVDEIVINYISKINKPILNGAYATKYLKHRNYKGKITLNDITLDTINNINKKHLWKDIDNFTGLLHNFLRFDIDFYERNNLLKACIRKGTIAHIFGLEYPIINRLDTSFYCLMPFSNYILTSYNNKNISFFTSTQFPELHIKQCHVLAKYMYINNLSTEKDCKISIRDEFNSFMFLDKTGGNLKNQVMSTSENYLIISRFIEDSYFKDIYVNTVYKNIIKPRLGINSNHSKSYLLFEV